VHRQLDFVYAVCIENMDEERRTEFDAFLDRPPNVTIEAVPGVPIPAWMPLDEIPPDMLPPEMRDAS
jgi:hypothetical protein